MPVTDKARRVIGIITWQDFFKHIDMQSYQKFQGKFRRFIQRTLDINAKKPEAIGLIMTQSVITLPETACGDGLSNEFDRCTL
jgi:CBS domain-containing membrane protein